MYRKVSSANMSLEENNKKIVSTENFQKYQETMAIAIKRDLAKLGIPYQDITMDVVIKNNPAILAYDDIDKVQLDFPASYITTFDPKSINTEQAVRAILNGDILWEDTAAGEATRLALGTKYTLDSAVLAKAFAEHPNFRPDLTDEERKALKTLTSAQLAEAKDLLQKVLPVNFGVRHVVAHALAIRQIAEQNGYDPEEVLKKQTKFLILNEDTVEQIIQELEKYKFFGFNPERFYFMVQKKGEGYTVQNGEVILVKGSEKRLYNHGAMKLQSAMNKEVFYLFKGERVYLDAYEWEEILSSMKLQLSANIEDLDYLENAIDLPNIAIGLEMGKKGYEMVMTAVKQKANPQKGGYFGLLKGKVYCFETDGDPNITKLEAKAKAEGKGSLAEQEYIEALAKIKYLNKNMNLYPNPVVMLRKMKEKELPIHATVKGGYIYPQTPQGDLNFILNTAFIMEETPRPIRNLKEQADILDMLKAFLRQDQNQIFVNYLKQYGYELESRIEFKESKGSGKKVEDKGAKGNA